MCAVATESAKNSHTFTVMKQIDYATQEVNILSCNSLVIVYVGSICKHWHPFLSSLNLLADCDGGNAGDLWPTACTGSAGALINGGHGSFNISTCKLTWLWKIATIFGKPWEITYKWLKPKCMNLVARNILALQVEVDSTPESVVVYCPPDIFIEASHPVPLVLRPPLFRP